MREGYEELIKLVHFMEKNLGKCVDQFVRHCIKRGYQIHGDRYLIRVSLKTLCQVLRLDKFYTRGKNVYF